MNFDLFLPIGILVVIVIYLIYSRTKFEKEIVELYEQKFENWKEHNSNEIKKGSCKEFVGVIYEQDYKLSIELVKKDVQARLKKGNFEIKE